MSSPVGEIGPRTDAEITPKSAHLLKWKGDLEENDCYQPSKGEFFIQL